MDVSFNSGRKKKKSSLFIVLWFVLWGVLMCLKFELCSFTCPAFPSILKQKEKGRQPPTNTVASESVWSDAVACPACLFHLNYFSGGRLRLCHTAVCLSVCLSVQINISLRDCSEVARLCETISKHSEQRGATHPSTSADKNQEGL